MKRIINKVKKNKLITGIALSLFFKILGISSSYLLFFFLSRTGGAKSVGEFSLGFNYVTLMGSLATIGLPLALLRFGAPMAEKKHWVAFRNLQKKVVILQFISGIIFAVLTFFVGNKILDVLYKQELSFEYIIMLSIAIPFLGVNLVNAELIRSVGIIRLSELFRTIIVPFVTVVVLFGFWLLRIYVMEIYVYIGVIVAAGITSSLTVMGVVHNLIMRCIKSKDAPQKAVGVAKLLHTALPMTITLFSVLVMGKITILMLGFYHTPEIVGQFQIALKVSMTTSVLLQAVNIIIGPRIAAQYWNVKQEDMQMTLQTGAKMSFLGSLPFFLLFLIVPKYILLLFGNEFVDAVPVLVIMTLGQIINAWAGSVGSYLNMTGKQRVLSIFVVISMIVNIILNIVLIPSYGEIGAAIATAVAMAVWNIFATIYVKKKYGISTYFIFRLDKCK